MFLPPTHYHSAMSRPLRIEFSGAIYHVTSRGDRRELIYRDDVDRVAHLEVIAQAMSRFDAEVLAYCLMGNHYHLVVHTRQANLSRLMRHVNGVYTQTFNRRHGVVGHLFQGRFKAILVDRDAYLLALCRYVERNPVAAGLVQQPADWVWSSCRAHVGQVPTPEWLDSDGLQGHLLGRPVAGAADRRRASRQYADLVGLQQPDEASFWQRALRAQVYLGSAEFVSDMQARASEHAKADREIPKAQRMRNMAWPDCLAACEGDRNAALHMAYTRSGWSMTHLALQTGLSISQVSRLIARAELDAS